MLIVMPRVSDSVCGSAAAGDSAPANAAMTAEASAVRLIMAVSPAGAIRPKGVLQPWQDYKRDALFAQILEELFDLCEESFAFGLGLAALARLLELAQQLLLALRQMNRRLDHDLDIHVAARGRAQHGHALA